ncbi:TrmO family methyltransferase domain-containing protein [Streptomyces mirabilis]
MTAQSIEVPIVATVVGGHLKVGDDFQGGVESIIRLHPDCSLDTLQGIEEFSHLQVTWYFSEGSPSDVALHARSPRNNPEWPATGTFVHRNHRRPARVEVVSGAGQSQGFQMAAGRGCSVVARRDGVDNTPAASMWLSA